MRWQRLSLRSVAADEGMWQPALTVRRSFKMFSSVIDLLTLVVCYGFPSAMTVQQLTSADDRQKCETLFTRGEWDVMLLGNKC